MPVFNWRELSEELAEKIDGETSWVIWGVDEAEDWAVANGYESLDEALNDSQMELPRWRFVIAPADGSDYTAGWTLVDEHWGYPDMDSGFSYNGNAPAFEGVLYPMPGDKVTASQVIDEALSEGVSNYGAEVPSETEFPDY